MWLLIREASAARNLHALIPLAREYGPARIAFCTDDREPEHIADDGHINSIVRDAVALGIPPEDALVMATLNPALYHGLAHLGAIAPGYQADLLVLLRPRVVRPGARPQGAGGRSRRSASVPVPDWVRHTVRVGALGPDDFRIPWQGGKARVIGLVPGQIVTESLVDEPTVRDGCAVADPARDLAKIAVLERHLGTGRIGLGFVRGFGLQRGAFGATRRPRRPQPRSSSGSTTPRWRARSTGSSSSAAGSSSSTAARSLAELPLPVAGLLSDRPLAEVLAASRALNAAAARRSACAFPHPFQVLAFLALSVIPSLKITDRGLVDVDRFELVPLAV